MTSSPSDCFYKKTISSHFLDLLKENGLLSFRWEFRLKVFFDKTGRGWSRDTVIKKFKNEIERFFGYDWPQIVCHGIS